MAYKIKVHGTGRGRKNPVLELYGQGQARENPLELSPVALVAIIGMTVMATSVVVYLLTRPSSVLAPPAPTAAPSSPSVSPSSSSALAGLGAIGSNEHLAATYMHTVDRLLNA